MPHSFFAMKKLKPGDRIMLKRCDGSDHSPYWKIPPEKACLFCKYQHAIFKVYGVARDTGDVAIMFPEHGTGLNALTFLTANQYVVVTEDTSYAK